MDRAQAVKSRRLINWNILIAISLVQHAWLRQSIRQSLKEQSSYLDKISVSNVTTNTKKSSSFDIKTVKT
ncbi:MAG: hypothetical protein ACRD5E_10630 [Nitrososphaeraceae archaeon]